MASLPYPLNRLYTHIVSVIATTQSACILMSVWVWQGCHTLLQIPILLFLKNLFFCLFKNNLFSCPLVFPQQHVLMFFCLFKQQHVLMFSCLSHNNLFSCSSVFPKEPYPPSNPVFMSPKKNGWEQRSQPLSLELCLLFSKADSLLRTYACACTALCAEIRVDRILFAFWDCLYWALANTCTACDAVVTNYVSHN